MKAVVAAFNQEKTLVGAFSVITNLRMELFEALIDTDGVCRTLLSPDCVQHTIMVTLQGNVFTHITIWDIKCPLKITMDCRTGK